MTHPPPIRALIAEDEPILATALTHALQRLWPELQIAATCANGVEAVQQGLLLRPEILFLDIKMPGKTGLQAAEELAAGWPPDQPFPQIVFVTAYDEFALAAFEHAAADYVLKPVNDVRLGKTVQRLRRCLDGGQSSHQEASGHRNLAQLLGQLQSMMPPVQRPARLSIIRAAVGNQVRMIPVAEVLYFVALDKYINVVTTDGAALIRSSLKELLPQLDSQQFWQIHRGTIVNAERIDSATRDDTGKLTLNLRGHAAQLKVSPLYAHLFRQM
ncbi:LytR/AlgR family response regulator transcription factor [Janthinobacterium agaricidamnosum]|uniref:Response regulator n=1 Tax=Janthinobacterium agaricidamnosum NBRC 102515 = DSM 9628 TaxID=1349767 RepID=W0VAY2_9BURK|nr:LytTR family DNA-binding domain-containing protein [Janthinobacterium agaricidamnosum]CDG84795.1 response regulator [Janthinobacterium agaricidamnosum NBRC 102515 = DSM 9628]